MSFFQAGLSSYKHSQVFALPPNMEEDNDQHALRVEHIIGLFVMLLIGCLVGAGVFAIELIVSNYRIYLTNTRLLRITHTPTPANSKIVSPCLNLVIERNVEAFCGGDTDSTNNFEVSII